MVIPYSKIVLWHKVVFTLLCLDVLSYCFEWYSFTTFMQFVLGVIYFYTLFKLDWKSPASGKPVFVIKVIVETIFVLRYILLFFGYLFGLESNYTTASGSGYKIKERGFFTSYSVLYHHLYLVERPYADHKGPNEIIFKDGEITNVVIADELVRVSIRWESSMNEYIFEKL